MLHDPLQAASVQRAELLAAFSYALDITEGQPEGHCIRSCWIGTEVGRALGLSDRDLGELYYTVLAQGPRLQQQRRADLRTLRRRRPRIQARL